MQSQFLDIKRIIGKLYLELEQLENAIEEELPHTAGWIADRKVRSGECVQYWYYYEGKKRKARRIPKDKIEDVSKMIEVFAYRERELRNIRYQMRLIRLCMKAMKLTPQQIIQLTYPIEQPKRQHSVDVPYAESRRHPTLKGDFVRSKSEALLANLLYANGIEYEYEKPLYLNGHRIHPDFTINKPGGRELYWEHRGMAGDVGYDRNWSKKSRVYAENGISEGNGLIITRDVAGVFDELDAIHKIELYQLAKR